MVQISRAEWTAIILAMVAVIASVGWSALVGSSLCACGLVTPNVGKEELSMQSYQFNTPTNLTMNIRNMGTVTVSFTAYYVTLNSQARYSSTGWSGATIPVNEVVAINILIDGQAFTFQPRTSYTVTMVTTRNNQFVFTAITN